MLESPPRIIVTTGEPAGIGPDIVLKAAAAAANDTPDRATASITAIGDRDMLAARAGILGVKVKVVDDDLPHRPHQPASPACCR